MKSILTQSIAIAAIIHISAGESNAQNQMQPAFRPPPPHRPMQPGVTPDPRLQRPAVQPPNQPPAPNVPPVRIPQGGFGAPLPGLTDSQLADFIAGRDEFQNVEDAAGGLGPIFNNVSCVSCHRQGGSGGAGTINVVRFGREENGEFDPLADLGGSLLQRFSIARGTREIVPPQANVRANRQTSALFGLGLIEAIPEETILAGVDRGVPPEVRGRASMIFDPVSGTTRVGRFGWKGQHSSVEAFCADAYMNEMGVTNALFPVENAPNGRADVLAALDKIADPEDTADPETGKADFQLAADFVKYLGAPPRIPMNASALAGQVLFGTVGCADCHTPQMRTGVNDVAALSEKTVALYSDLLLHDMGNLGDGVVQGATGSREFRTPPLWGLRVSAPYLHDGRARTVDQAIRLHDGQGRGSREKYNALSAPQRRQLLDFLATL